MGFSRGTGVSGGGRKKVIDMGDATALTLSDSHTNTSAGCRGGKR